MATVTFRGKPVQVHGQLPKIGAKAPAFSLTAADMSTVGLTDMSGKVFIMNVVQSVDTSVNAATICRLGSDTADLEGVEMLCVSMDLPFAQNRFCATHELGSIRALSAFRSPEFGLDYGLTITDTSLAGLLASALLVVDAQGVVRSAELVPDLTGEPDYGEALKAALDCAAA